MSDYSIYILASKRNGTLYAGFTSDLVQRIYAHKNNLVEGFTKKYSVHRLVYYEIGGDYDGALQREMQIKEWKRQWKINLIESINPEWRDLYDDIILLDTGLRRYGEGIIPELDAVRTDGIKQG